jgi:hypothetical protein
MFAPQGVADFAEDLDIHQPDRSPSRRVSGAPAPVVKLDAGRRIPGVAGVQATVRTPDDVDAVGGNGWPSHRVG